MRNRNVLISGASVAGPALAYWLGRYGFTPTVVERAPALRGGGYAVDFRGPTHMTVLERMGVLDELRELQTGGSPMRFVDAAGRELLHLPAEFSGGEVEVFRADLSRVLYEHSRDTAEYVFGDSVAAMTETPEGVQVTFEHGAPRTFDLVVGADGLHSNVRRLAFGPESRFVRAHGYYIAGWDVPNHLHLDHTTLLYNTPGRLASVAGDHRDPARASAMCIFASAPLDDDRHDTEQQKRILADAYAGLGWEVPRLLEALRDAPDLYFDTIGRVAMDRWTRGRVALLGDAGYGVTLGGLGTGTAVVGAYVLAGELAAAGGDHRRAFAAYEQQLRGYVKIDKNNPGRFLAPRTAAGIHLRNRYFSTRLGLGMLLKMAQTISSELTLKDYQVGRRATPS